MLDCAARHQCERPAAHLFYMGIDQLSEDARLTVAEQRVVTLRLLGHSHQLIADELGIKVNTVAKHLTAVHRKSNTSGLGELYAKYFTPRLT
jgi:DNA-binding CsgD family transcriptional regulator